MPASVSTPRRLLIGLPPALLVFVLAWLFWPRSVVRVSEPTPQPSAEVQAKAPRPEAALAPKAAAAPDLPASTAERRDLAGQASLTLPAAVPQLAGSLRDARSGAPIAEAELRWSPGATGLESAAEGPQAGGVDVVAGVVAAGGSATEGVQPAADFSARSDSRGQFLLPWPGPGDFTCRHPEYVSVRYPGLEPKDGLVVLMERAASLNVRVEDPDSEPVAGALVEVWRCDGLNPLAEVSAEMRTDAAGIALVTGLRAGNFLVRATPPAADPADPGRPAMTRHALQSGIAVAPGGQAEVRLTLSPGSKLALELVASGGEAPSEAGAERAAPEACLVTLQPRWEVLPGAKQQAAEISQLVALNGKPLEFGPLNTGPWTIVCWTPWAQRYEFASAVPRQEPLRLELPVGGAWAGVVRAEGQAVEGALVAIVEATRAGELSYQAAQSIWSAEQQLNSAAAARAVDPISSGLQPPVSGGAGTPAGPVSGNAALSAPNRLLVASTDARGRFLFPRRPAGVELYCLVWPPEYQPVAGPGSLTPTGGRISSAGFLQQGSSWVPPEFELRRTAGLQGWVRCLDGASPAGTKLQLRVAEASAAEPVLTVEADSRGAFRFEAVSNQELILEARLQGYKPVSLSIPANAARGEVRPPAFSLELEPVFSVRGQVLDWDGRAQPGALVRATIDRLELARTTADQAGAFVLTGLPRALVQFSASAPQTSSTTGSEQLLRLPSVEPLVLRLRPELPVGLASVEGEAIRAGSASRGTEGGAIPGLFVRGLGPYAVLHQSGSAYRIEGLRLPVTGFELGAPGFESVRIPLQELAPGGHRELPRVELHRAVAVRFTGLNDLLSESGVGPIAPRDFLLLVPLDPDLGGPLGQRKVLDLAYPDRDEVPNGVWTLPAAAFELRVPSLERRAVLDFSEAPAELEVYLPSVLAAPTDSAE